MLDTAKLSEARDFIRSKTAVQPTIGLILGSGLGVLAEDIQEAVHIPYREIPHFPISTVEGHKGQLVIGQLCGKAVIALQGRFHYYEGYSADAIAFPVRVMKELGVQTLMVTNAAGGINEEFSVGQLMLIKDHINFSGKNPLIGPNWDTHGPRFPDMSTAYDPEYRALALQIAKELNISMSEGTYIWFSGPSYETPAEIRMSRILGADAVGMSTVPEVIVARHAGIRVIGISCVSNMAAGILEQPLSHQEVMEVTERVREQFVAFVRQFVQRV
ncbi:purine-nucleoside phosphorylase [Fodinisporobacter ferrooxydans]|uniref:Purine nucleoside phosphorylase n=1 Tax=Fodinisporobacter ferrooxydans TaxID=2901836 RepID=A0ABY4CHX5_9BACL|nr:purine-nucleoside phosphorylase [Alicyclobacillaceae bacterium MYW30-H2]